MKTVNKVLVLILIIVLALICFEHKQIEFHSNYTGFKIINNDLHYDPKKILEEYNKVNDVDIYSMYYNAKTKQKILYTTGNCVAMYKLSCDKFDNIDQYKELENDIFYIDSGNYEELTQLLLTYGLTTVVQSNSMDHLIYGLIFIAIITYFILIFLHAFEINNMRNEICIKKIFGVKPVFKIKWKSYLGYVAIIIVIFMIGRLILFIKLPIYNIFIIMYIVLTLDIIRNYFYNKTYKNSDILNFIKGESIDNLFLKYEYAFLVLLKFIAIIIVFVTSASIVVTETLLVHKVQYDKIEGYYNSSGYISKQGISQKELSGLENNDSKDVIYDKSDKMIVDYMEDNYDGFYEYDPFPGETIQSGTEESSLIIANEQYLKINHSEELIKDTTKDYFLIPEYLKDQESKIINDIDWNPNFWDIKYDIYYYSEDYDLINTENSTVLSYHNPIIYINQNYYNQEFYTYGQQALLFKEGDEALSQYYADNNIEDDGLSDVVSQYNNYSTTMHNLFKMMITSMFITFFTIFIYTYTISVKINSFLIDEAKTLTVKRIFGKPNIYRYIYIRYFYLDIYFLLVSSLILGILYLLNINMLIIFSLLVGLIALLFGGDTLLVKYYINKQEKNNILNTIKGD